MKSAGVPVTKIFKPQASVSSTDDIVLLINYSSKFDETSQNDGA